MPTRPARLSIMLPLVLSLGLCACSDNGTALRLAMTRWATADSTIMDTTLAYTVHVYTWKSEGARLFTSPRTSEIGQSNLRVYLVGHWYERSVPHFSRNRVIYDMDHAVPCNDLMFRAVDSMLYFSYLDVDMAKSNDCYVDEANGTAFHPSRRLVAILLDGTVAGSPSEPLDTLSMLAELATEAGRKPDVNLSLQKTRLCPTNGADCLQLDP